MDRKEFKKEKAYVKPTIEVIRGNIKGQMLASSPAVQPGGGGGGHITVEPPKEDDGANGRIDISHAAFLARSVFRKMDEQIKNGQIKATR